MEKHLLKIGDRILVQSHYGISGIYPIVRVTDTQAVIETGINALGNPIEVKLRREYSPGAWLNKIGYDKWERTSYNLEEPGDAEKLAEKILRQKLASVKWSDVPAEKIARILKIINEV